MKASSIWTVPGLSFVLSLFVPIYSVINAQVMIKERVEIQALSGPADTVTSGIGRMIGTSAATTQSNTTIPVPESSYVMVRVLSSATGASLDIYAFNPIDSIIMKSANENVGGRWISALITEPVIFNIGIQWNYWGQKGSQSGVICQEVEQGVYRLYFEDMGWDWDYDDIVVQVNVSKSLPDGSLRMRVQAPNEIQCPDDADMQIQLVNNTDQPQPPPNPLSFTVAIEEGGAYLALGRTGNLTQSITAAANANGTAIVRLNAYGVDIDEPKTVTIKITPSDASIPPQIVPVVVIPSAVKLVISPNVTTYGTKVNLHLELRRWDGSIGSFPEDDYIYFGVDDGYGAGHLLSADSSQSDDYWIDGNSPDAYFIPEEEEPQPDTVVVQLEAGADEGWTTGRLLVVRNANHPPVIDSLKLDPSRKYFPINSRVTISAMVMDPDGDSVRVDYLPGTALELQYPGPYEITVVATDEHGARTEKKEIIHCVYVYSTPSLDRVIDGGSIDYQVKIIPEGDYPVHFLWGYEPKNTPAGNLPPYDLMPDKVHEKTTIAKAWWYAFPDQPGPARKECLYTLDAKTVIGEDEFAPSAGMAVFLPDTGGTTSPPKSTGAPLIQPVMKGGKIEWIVSSKHTLTRKVGSISMRLPQTSQFYEKVYAHERKHLQQQIDGLASNIWSVDDLWSRMKGLTASSEADLNKKLDECYKQFNQYHYDAWIEGLRKREIEAYSVSDQIPPFYIYQLSNQLDKLK